MQVELTELLKRATISHPSAVTRAEYSNGNLLLVIRGYPWWLPNAKAAEGEIEFIFEEISSGDICIAALDLNYLNSDEFLEDWDVRPLVSFDWGKPADNSIYCSGPLLESLALFAVVHDWLADLDADSRAEDYLNGANLLSKFAEITGSTSYLVARAPDALRDIICQELQRQNIPHNVIKTSWKPDHRLRVQIGVTSFLCARAFARFDERH